MKEIPENETPDVKQIHADLVALTDRISQLEIHITESEKLLHFRTEKYFPFVVLKLFTLSAVIVTISSKVTIFLAEILHIESGYIAVAVATVQFLGAISALAYYTAVKFSPETSLSLLDDVTRKCYQFLEKNGYFVPKESESIWKNRELNQGLAIVAVMSILMFPLVTGLFLLGRVEKPAGVLVDQNLIRQQVLDAWIASVVVSLFIMLPYILANLANRHIERKRLSLD